MVFQGQAFGLESFASGGYLDDSACRHAFGIINHISIHINTIMVYNGIKRIVIDLNYLHLERVIESSNDSG